MVGVAVRCHGASTSVAVVPDALRMCLCRLGGCGCACDWVVGLFGCYFCCLWGGVLGGMRGWEWGGSERTWRAGRRRRRSMMPGLRAVVVWATRRGMLECVLGCGCGCGEVIDVGV